MAAKIKGREKKMKLNTYELKFVCELAECMKVSASALTELVKNSKNFEELFEKVLNYGK